MCIISPTPGPPGKHFPPNLGQSFAPSQAEQRPKLPSLETSTVALVCIYSSNLSYI